MLDTAEHNSGGIHNLDGTAAGAQLGDLDAKRRLRDRGVSFIGRWLGKKARTPVFPGLIRSGGRVPLGFELRKEEDHAAVRAPDASETERGRRALLGRVGGSGPGRGLLGLSGRNREMGRFFSFFFLFFLFSKAFLK